MRTSCLINNYNYEKYVVDAIDSAINQTVPFDEIIVVDDGSTDNSLAIIQENFADNNRIKIIAKINQGQLSCFNTGFSASSGDIIFFLDADDLYEPNYLEEALAYYKDHEKCDFLFCALTEFGKSNRINRPFTHSKELGFTIVLTMFLKKWLGAPTSAISIRRDILQKILPMPEVFLRDWRVRADDCLVWGSSLAGGYKCYFDKLLVRYRVHNNNNFTGKKFDFKYNYFNYHRAITVKKFFWYFSQQFFYGKSFELYELAKAEFRTIPDPDRKDFNTYVSIVMKSNMPIRKKLEMIGSIFGSYLNKNKKYR